MHNNAMAATESVVLYRNEWYVLQHMSHCYCCILHLYSVWVVSNICAEQSHCQLTCQSVTIRDPQSGNTEHMAQWRMGARSSRNMSDNLPSLVHSVELTVRFCPMTVWVEILMFVLLPHIQLWWWKFRPDREANSKVEGFRSLVIFQAMERIWSSQV